MDVICSIVKRNAWLLEIKGTNENKRSTPKEDQFYCQLCYFKPNFKYMKIINVQHASGLCVTDRLWFVISVRKNDNSTDASMCSILKAA